jgi:hypothetical protein
VWVEFNDSSGYIVQYCARCWNLGLDKLYRHLIGKQLRHRKFILNMDAFHKPQQLHLQCTYFHGGRLLCPSVNCFGSVYGIQCMYNLFIEFEEYSIL